MSFEKYCGKCGGMVNANGCGQEACPVRPAAQPEPEKKQAKKAKSEQTAE